MLLNQVLHLTGPAILVSAASSSGGDPALSTRTNELVSLFCHFPSILNKRIKRKNSLQVSRAMDVELQILKHLARDAHPTVAIVDEYCAEYKDL
ncbi:hypothetical protein PQG02_36665 (plasmid) [Nostoc sp. UHCC 0926]|uniref:hypothetical protein n=1 Tax=Nostoc sp. UHCC 0926 TaxID=3025190 RepID=UPI00235F31CB|nr:hypothetical protein [Nostoc sp. UHCC 0926]WDD36646.1 hypothetical protein PQG02_36665 [Nostoc sp. UHCC 0926]